MGDLSEERLRKIASNWVRATDSEIREMASQLVGFMTAQATSAERVRSVVREAIMALLSERKLYIVEPQPPTMGEIALEAYGFGKACDAVALQGDELQALLATIADRIASQLTTPSSPTDIGRQRAASSAHASHVRDAVREAFVAVARLSTHSFPQRVVEDIATRVAEQLVTPAAISAAAIHMAIEDAARRYAPDVAELIARDAVADLQLAKPSDDGLDAARRSAIAALRNGTTLAEIVAALLDDAEPAPPPLDGIDQGQPDPPVEVELPNGDDR